LWDGTADIDLMMITPDDGRTVAQRTVTPTQPSVSLAPGGQAVRSLDVLSSNGTESIDVFGPLEYGNYAAYANYRSWGNDGEARPEDWDTIGLCMCFVRCGQIEGYEYTTINRSESINVSDYLPGKSKQFDSTYLVSR